MLEGVLSKKSISHAVGTFPMYFTRFHFVHSNAHHVFQQFIAEPQNVFIGEPISFANCRLKSTHWYDLFQSKSFFFHIHLSNMAVIF